MLAAQVLGLGLGATDARADTGHPPRQPGRALGTVVRTGTDTGAGTGTGTGTGGLLDGAVDGAARTVDGLDPVGAADLGDTLGHHLAGGELPLPGHQADRPDA
ncbi:hypothetical protein ACFUEL_30230, partial [Kitasatospora sp. NPDC057198]